MNVKIYNKITINNEVIVPIYSPEYDNTLTYLYSLQYLKPASSASFRLNMPLISIST